MKSCKDCKFYQRAPGYPSEYDQCTRKHTEAHVPDPVMGGTKRVCTTPMSGFVRCHDERTAFRPWKCGSKARHFQPKVSTPEDYHW
ncbi:hypothetical protein [Rhodanobacter sp. MP7CTX1]|uniref:hypothetical protein n=1 Tax=Rhodanobacter sp. MP7CTX1 TaxID=2723084 RepID=UPI00161B874A|nr:hypothetical protein [Rhodanobacter sp. MP7CTX1]MBB6185788.1 hypothetical protein [Rhodanobacter sp. MP7CTX1]